MKILVVDDEPLLIKGIRFNLMNEGYDVITAENGEQAVNYAKNTDIDLIVMDVMMPVMSGLEACAKIREFSEVPIILLTAKAEDMDKLMGFENGADDYLTKPFNILELKARVRALLRRSARSSSPASATVKAGAIELKPGERNAYRDGVTIDLTAKEFDVIELLMRHPNQVFSREALLDTVWKYEYKSDIRTVDVHIRRLREKLEKDPANPEFILTKWGVGYYFKG